VAKTNNGKKKTSSGLLTKSNNWEFLLMLSFRWPLNSINLGRAKRNVMSAHKKWVGRLNQNNYANQITISTHDGAALHHGTAMGPDKGNQ
jgi:hypothetical protein